MGSLIFCSPLFSQHACLVPYLVRYMLITLVEILLHIIIVVIIVMYVRGND
jgi:hypothetical protein